MSQKGKMVFCDQLIAKGVWIVVKNLQGFSLFYLEIFQEQLQIWINFGSIFVDLVIEF